MPKLYRFKKGISYGFMSGLSEASINETFESMGVTFVAEGSDVDDRFVTEHSGKLSDDFIAERKAAGDLEEVESITDGLRTQSFHIRGYYALHPDEIDERGYPVDK